MSEEEKEAMKNAKEVLKFTTYLADIGHKDLEILLNLIEKQQKEIQELNILLKEKSKDIGHMVVNYISKDKIKEKIKSYEGLKIMDKSAYEEQVKPLKELLEE